MNYAKHILLLVLFTLCFSAYSQKVNISPNLYLEKLTEHVYVHTSLTKLAEWGKFPSNGLIYINGSKAWLLDTPMDDSLTIKLIDHLEQEMQLKIIGFIPNHFHDDCTAGMDILKEHNIPSYCFYKTSKLHTEEPYCNFVFHSDTTFLLDDSPIQTFYPGEAHSPDNIVCYLPNEKVLFGGCMVKSADSKTLGNLSDANLENWPQAINNVIDKYPNLKSVIPGHGKIGETNLLQHTLDLLRK
ncbi:Zn-dependent hydrolase, glyoxylase [Owenweeksia hongkongensis DSM 17368]|uniref:beta-lactamase n=1 Tax=Owenweeksia hongkongensis (strain DSM 17368 / CIP 108786 / JCM 12287 / NRRL B-23963 / UST20020801) TaxID=926562 RepID=G8QZI6_OWEHD|nr:subclass B1 metallo-beta-lactamase [Owenweeksia hongkongensis]AEV33639.1 Zn-dependent hydrolase, glyoxylase [Owenweeksia hongkongensis DSM 17368]